MMIAGGFFMSLNDLLLKDLTTFYPLGELIVLRAVALLLLIFGFMAFGKCIREITDVTWTHQVGRGIVNAVAMILFVIGLKHLHLNDAVVLGMTGPLFLIGISAVLGEVVSATRIMAGILGFIGVTLIIGPSMAFDGWFFLFPLGAAFLEGLREIMTRRLPSRDSLLATLFHTTWIIAAAGLLFENPSHWTALAPTHATALLGCTVLLGVSQYLMIAAFRSGEASSIAPFRYVIVLWATLFSIVFFDHLPNIAALVGSALVIVAGAVALRTGKFGSELVGEKISCLSFSSPSQRR